MHARHFIVFIIFFLALSAPSRASSPSQASQVCSALLDKSNIVWKHVSGTDYYTVKTPDGFTEPAWKNFYNSAYLDIQSTTLDFAGHENKPAQVYAVNYEARYHYHHYIVTAPGEEDTLHQRLSQVTNEDTLAQLEADLAYPREATFRASPIGRYSKKEKTAPMKSALYDASNTKTYNGLDTRSKILIHENRPYLVATSSELAHAITIFDFGKDGQLEPLCAHSGAKSGKTDIVTQLGTSPFVCPSDLKETPIAWHNRTATLDLVEWGGKRPLLSVTTPLGSGGTGMSTLYIGDVNAPSAEKEKNWLNLAALKEDDFDSVGLRLTDSGAYIWVWSDDATGTRPPKTTYYRIHANMLTPVCSVVSKTIPPEGYAKTLPK